MPARYWRRFYLRPVVSLADAGMTNAETDARGSPFWRFSLGFYRRADVSEACIALQDQCGVDVNLLLFLLWLGLAKRQLSLEDVRAIEAKSRAWSLSVVVPLRSVRRTLRGGSELVSPTIAELFRTKIKAVELEAERLQQEALYALAQDPSLGQAAPSVEEAARANIRIYEVLMGREFTKNAIEVLLRALGGPQAEG
jgi:uncharacterized protein (TIGR02444 family)